MVRQLNKLDPVLGSETEYRGRYGLVTATTKHSVQEITDLQDNYLIIFTDSLKKIIGNEKFEQFELDLKKNVTGERNDYDIFIDGIKDFLLHYYNEQQDIELDRLIKIAYYLALRKYRKLKNMDNDEYKNIKNMNIFISLQLVFNLYYVLGKIHKKQ